MAPAAKLPEASRATMALAVLADVAVEPMDNVPAPAVTVIPPEEPKVATLGAAPVEPTTIWPSVIAGISTIAPEDENMILLLFKAVPEFVPPRAIGKTPDEMFPAERFVKSEPSTAGN